ncbi:MAG TPA: MFS transporter, partial [Ktedonobacterales bacterium]|nr:MFS transporter [Ktedonobacterales bacterium]
AIGISSGISGVALAAGPLLGGVLIQISGWQAIFFVNLPIGIAVLISGMNLLAESRNPAAHRLDIGGQILAIAGLTALTYALIEGNAQGWGSLLIVGLFVAAGVLLAAFVVVEARADEPMLPLGFFKNASFSVANAVALVVGFALLGTVFFISQYFQGVQGFVPLASGLRSLPNTMGIFVAAPIAGALAARLGPRVPITLGALCSGTALLLLMRLGPATPYAAIWWNLGLGGIGFGLMLSPLAAAVLGALPPTRSGLASSMINMSRQVGGVFGVALLGALVQGQYASNIANGLTQHGIPSQISQSIANAIAGAGIQAGKVLGRQHLPLPTTTLHALANQSFTDALHGAFLVAGLALLVSAAASAFLLGRRQPSVAANPEATAESQPPEAMPAVAEIA